MAFAYTSTPSSTNTKADADWKAKRIEQDRRALSDLIEQDRRKRLNDSLELWNKILESK